MREIAQWALPPEGTAARQALEKLIEKRKRSNPHFDSNLKKLHDLAVAIATIQDLNGAGLPLDEMIREYNVEYNNRNLNHSLRDMPTSFNIMEAFNLLRPDQAVFRIPKEKDYILSYIDFLDYVTSDELDQDVTSSVALLEEGTIYSYNGIHSPDDLTFDCGDQSHKFGVAGVSLIRHDNEISLMMLAGEYCNLDEKTEHLKELWNSSTKLPHKPHITPDNDLEVRAVPLNESKNLWKTIVLSRIDVKRYSIDVRYIAQDAGNSFTAKTDDLSVYMNSSGEFLTPEAKTIAMKSAKTMDEYQPLFEFIKTCLHLPAFVQAREDSIRIERHPTRFKSLRGKPKYKKLERLAPQEEKIAMRDVAQVLAVNRHGPIRRSFYAPNIKTESSGYWKKLPLDVIGQDKAGQPIHGRTWVERTLTWIEDASEVQPLHTNIAGKHHLGNKPGTIYVMRSAAHEKDIFKVGLTTRTTDIRAGELTRSTSSPDQFLVVEEWDVPDCELAEKLIHERLAAYRINPRREFFRARYNVIFSAVTDVMKELGINT